MLQDLQVKYNGWRLVGVPEEQMKGLKVVDVDGDIGTVAGVTIVKSPEKNNPNRIIYITINWGRKGCIANYHYLLGWVVVGDRSSMSANPVIEMRKSDAIIQPASKVIKKTWFQRLLNRLGI